MKNIRNEKDYNLPSNCPDEIFYAQPGTPEDDDTEAWVNLIIRYKKNYFSVENLRPSSVYKNKKQNEL